MKFKHAKKRFELNNNGMSKIFFLKIYVFHYEIILNRVLLNLCNCNFFGNVGNT